MLAKCVCLAEAPLRWLGMDIVELLLELQLPGHCVGNENPFDIRPRIPWRLGIPNVAQKLIAHTGCKAVENSA